MSVAAWPTEGPTGVVGPGDSPGGWPAPGAHAASTTAREPVPGQATAPPRGQVAACGALMVVAVALHVAAMFPLYPGDPAAPVTALPHYIAMFACLEAGWAGAAFLALTGRWLREAVALGAGLGLVEAGALVANVLGGFDEASAGAAGAWLSLAGLAAGLAGVLLGASLVPMGRPGRGASSRGRSVALSMVGLVAVAEFWPSWQSGQLVYRGTGGALLSVPVNGLTFDQPLGVAVPGVLAGLAVGAVVVLGAFWAPPAAGAWAVVGAATALGSQLLEALVGTLEPVQDYLNGGRLTGIDVVRSHVSLTAVWGAETAAALALLVLATTVLARGRHRATATAVDAWPAA